MHASLLLLDAARAATPASVVRQVLREAGPLTTQALHAKLHASSANTLPPQRQPFATSHLSHLSPSQRRLIPKDELPPAPRDTNQWSMTYLKRKVLAGLEAQGDVVKTTRSRYEHLAGLTAGRKEAVEARAAATGGKGKAAAQASKKEEQDHVWVHRDAWEEAVLRSQREQAQVGEAEKAQRRREGAGKVEGQLRESYGLEGAQA
ncbi:hypothetical protein JCM8097_005840 [Rhodosporidiobolus ruineniae]